MPSVIQAYSHIVDPSLKEQPAEENNEYLNIISAMKVFVKKD